MCIYYAGYFMESGIPADKRTATALLYGIKVDTANMTRGVSPLDLEMFYRLFPLAEHALLQNLDTSVLHMKDLRAYANAIDTIENVNRVCFANTGVDCHEARQHPFRILYWRWRSRCGYCIVLPGGWHKAVSEKQCAVVQCG